MAEDKHRGRGGEVILKGIGVSPGVVSGPVFLMAPSVLFVPELTVSENASQQRFSSSHVKFMSGSSSCPHSVISALTWATTASADGRQQNPRPMGW